MHIPGVIGGGGRIGALGVTESMKILYDQRNTYIHIIPGLIRSADRGSRGYRIMGISTEVGKYLYLGAPRLERRMYGHLALRAGELDWLLAQTRLGLRRSL